MSEPRRRRVVAFCGAGVSADDGYPVMSAFNGHLRTSGLLSKEEQAAFDVIQAHCTDTSAMLGGSAQNIEQLASLLELMKLSRPQLRIERAGKYETPAAALDLVKKAIALVYSPRDEYFQSGACNLIRSLTDADDLDIITTNYDLNIEAGASSLSIPVEMTPGIQNACVRKVYDDNAMGGRMYTSDFMRNNQYINRRLRLIKLHGSVNWFMNGSDFIVDNRLTGRRSSEQYHQIEMVKWRRGVENWASPENTVIIPPTVIKPTFFGELQEQWVAAAKCLAEAQIVLFIGYSFPESDTFMRYFLATSLHRNVNVERVLIIDPAANQNFPRISTLLEHPQHSSIWETLPFKLQDVELPGALAGGWLPNHFSNCIKEMKSRTFVKALSGGAYLPQLDPEANIGQGLRGR